MKSKTTNSSQEMNSNSKMEIRMIPTASQISSQDDLLMKSLTQFFMEKNYLTQMLPIINKQANISLRILDWFVTNYSKDEPVVYHWHGKLLNVYCSYKDQLKAYSKKRFDPFKRRWQTIDGKKVDVGIKFWYTKEKYIETTVGQLNFFKWSIQNGVIAYVVDHLSDLVNKMLVTSQQKKKRAPKKKENNGNSNANANVGTNKGKPTKSNTTTYTNIVATADKERGEIEIEATETKVKRRNMKIVLSFN